MSMTSEYENPAESAARSIERALIGEDTRTRLLKSIPIRQAAPHEEMATPMPSTPKDETVEKIDHTFLPLDALEEVSKALMYGAAKGDAWKWAINPISWTERLAKAQRHILEFQKGINIDPSSGKQHIACAITQLMFLQSYVLTGSGTDDRFKR
jgi:hypothetical protein